MVCLLSLPNLLDPCTSKSFMNVMYTYKNDVEVRSSSMVFFLSVAYLFLSI